MILNLPHHQKIPKKKNYLACLPNELKYHIIHMNNLDGILSPETVHKIYDYVVKGDCHFQTKDEFLNYLNIEEFKFNEKTDHSYRNTEERVNKLIDQIHEN